MRKITSESINTFLNDQPFNKANMTVTVSDDETLLQLHGNAIASRHDGRLWITDANWQTVTTKERLNALPGVSIYQKNFEWFLNGQKWDGAWTEIKS